jgi:hypothetical protein
LMNIRHNTSLKSILEDDSISSTSIARMCSCLCKGVGLWLIVRPSIHSFRITHFIFILALHFRFNLIQPSTFNLFMCDYGHELETFSMHLTCCPFGGQRITTHDAIWNIMNHLFQQNGHVVWRERWYAFTSRVSLRTNFYMTQKDQVFIVNVVVIDLT